MLRCGCGDPDETEDGQEEALTEQEWRRVENTMRFVVEQQAQFEARLETNSALADRRFAQAERRLDRLERFADRVIRAGERRMAKAEARMARSELEIADLRAAMKSFLQALHRSIGNGRGKP